ncbi:MAG: glutathione S-transferase family protein [Kordiimonadaceae bacterium]|nr:glutathione S-transferase family protein [Kordiimonadaceae bacterium]
MSDLIIRSVPLSNFGQSVCMLAIEKGIPYVFEKTFPHSDEANEIHPFGKIPVMKHGDVTLCESNAIAHYIDSAFDGPKFFPKDPVLAAKVEEWISLHVCTFDQTMIRKYVLSYLFPKTENGEPDRARIDGALGDMEKQLAFIDSCLTGDYFVGDTLTYADLAMYPTLKGLVGFPESKAMIKNSPNVSRFISNMASRESAQKTKP